MSSFFVMFQNTKSMICKNVQLRKDRKRKVSTTLPDTATDYGVALARGVGSSSTVNNNLTQKPLQVLFAKEKTDVRVRIVNQAPCAVTLVGMLVPAATACLLSSFRTQILSGEFRESAAWCFCRPPCSSPASEAFSTTCGGTCSSLATSPESTVHLRHEFHFVV